MLFSGIKDKKYDFVFLGRLVPEKGVEVLLKAFQKLVIEKEKSRAENWQSSAMGQQRNILKLCRRIANI
jgi:glycogen synthase